MSFNIADILRAQQQAMQQQQEEQEDLQEKVNFQRAGFNAGGNANSQSEHTRYPPIPRPEPSTLEVIDEYVVESETKSESVPETKPEPKKDLYQPYLQLPDNNCNVYVLIAVNNKRVIKYKFASDIEPALYKNLRIYLAFWALTGQIYEPTFKKSNEKYEINIPDINYWYKVILKKQGLSLESPKCVMCDVEPTSTVLKEIRIYSGEEPIEFMKFDN